MAMVRLSGRLYVRWSARGNANTGVPTLVLLHGITNSGAGWVDAVGRWSSDYRIAAIDALGHGESDRFTDAELAGDGLDTAIGAIEALVTTTIEALESIVAASGPVVLVGHSMGGSTASVIAGRRPDLLRGALLEDPAWEEPSVAMWGQRGAQWLARAQADRLDPVASIAVELSDPELVWPRDEIEPWVVAHTQVDDRFVVLGRTEQREPWPEIAAAIATPTLLVTGTDGVIVDESMRAQLSEIANPLLEVAVIDGAGHSVRRDRGDAFHTLVDPWIAQRFAG
jgi:pimeloyl-ACP methyl ester carboxylesterase